MQTIAQTISSELFEKLKAAEFWGLLFDGSEDINKTEQEIVYIVSVSSNGEFSSDFLGLIHLGVKRSAQDIVDGLVQLFQECGLAEEWQTKLVSVCTDGAAVNVGVYNGVIPKLRQKVVIGDSLVHILCTSHTLENSAKSADRMVPYSNMLDTGEILQFLSLKFQQNKLSIGECKDELMVAIGQLTLLLDSDGKYRKEAVANADADRDKINEMKDLHSFGNTTLGGILQNYEAIMSVDKDSTLREWMRLKQSAKRLVASSVYDLVNIVKTSNPETYSNIWKVIVLSLTLPLSSAASNTLLVSHVKRMGPPGAAPPGPAMLIPEFCYLTGMTDKMRADYNIMKDLATHTRLDPERRQGRLNTFISNINDNADAQAELNTWGLGFENQLLTLSGRVLPGERISQGSRMFEYNPWQADWSRELRGVPLISSPELTTWLLLYTRRNTNEAQALLQGLHKVTGPLGIRMDRPVMIEYEDHQESLLRALQHNVGPQVQMVVVVLPSNRKDKYDSIKKYLCVDCPTPSQCVLSRTLSKPQTIMTVATKIALQMSCKMGGELWSVEIPLKTLMIVGIDCYHDTSCGKRSIGALVASLNQGMTRWYSKCVLQDRGQEIMDGLKMALIGALKDYLKFNDCLPSRIIIYRDGVGDGMLQSVVNYEVPQIMESISSMGQDYMPKLTVVVVKKRINSRFFTQVNGKVTNPPPGTVIDVEVTRPEWYDFYIVSQAVRQGSVSPTHYNVVYDTSGLKPDHLQRLTYKLCHMYYNWQGVVRVPAPCQYAHKLAFLVGQSIHKVPSVHLDDYLFYL
ncbi:piwi-like protein 1 [Diretmus argenteus]